MFIRVSCPLTMYICLAYLLTNSFVCVFVFVCIFSQSLTLFAFAFNFVVVVVVLGRTSPLFLFSNAKKVIRPRFHKHKYFEALMHVDSDSFLTLLHFMDAFIFTSCVLCYFIAQPVSRTKFFMFGNEKCISNTGTGVNFFIAFLNYKFKSPVFFCKLLFRFSSYISAWNLRIEWNLNTNIKFHF